MQKYFAKTGFRPKCRKKFPDIFMILWNRDIIPLANLLNVEIKMWLIKMNLLQNAENSDKIETINVLRLWFLKENIWKSSIEKKFPDVINYKVPYWLLSSFFFCFSVFHANKNTCDRSQLCHNILEWVIQCKYGTKMAPSLPPDNEI